MQITQHQKDMQEKQTLRNNKERQVQLSPRRRRVFVIEDDVELSTVIDRVLRVIDPKIEIEWATSAEEATARLVGRSRQSDRPPYDLIIADIFLEGEKTGLDFWRLCSQIFPEVPLVVTSALPVDKYFMTLGRDAIAPPFLAKPFSVAESKQLFESMLEYSDKNRKN